MWYDLNNFVSSHTHSFRRIQLTHDFEMHNDSISFKFISSAARILTFSDFCHFHGLDFSDSFISLGLYAHFSCADTWDLFYEFLWFFRMNSLKWKIDVIACVSKAPFKIHTTRAVHRSFLFTSQFFFLLLFDSTHLTHWHTTFFFIKTRKKNCLQTRILHSMHFSLFSHSFNFGCA